MAETMDPEPRVLHVSRDLLLVGQVASAARHQQIVCRACRDADEAVKRVGTRTRAVLVDLQLPGLDPVALAEALRQGPAELRLVGYAQHVHRGLLEAARDAGFDEVVTRGQFARHFTRYLSPDES